MPKRTLRTMRDRWQRDLDRIEAAYPCAVGQFETHNGPEHEVVRNLATAIAYMDGLITRQVEPPKP